MMKGLPASGKSSWAKEYVSLNKGTVRLNNDDMSTMLFGEAFAKGKSSDIESLRNHLLKHYMSKKMDIIVDNTNLHPKHETYLRKLVEDNNDEAEAEPSCYAVYEFIIKDFTDVPVAECIKRNKLRANSVPEKVIYDMYWEYLKPVPATLEQDKTLPKAIVVDIDGTIARVVSRGFYDHSRYYEDEPIMEVIDIVKLMQKDSNHIIFLTGREDTGPARSDTIRWLADKAKFNKDYTLIMRPSGDKTKDFDYKLLMFDTHMRGKYHVTAWFEDRIRNVEMARHKIGLIPVFQCGEGNF
jgi:predicted kinase